MKTPTRRDFIKTTGAALSGGLAIAACPALSPAAESPASMRLGLVTYNWGKDWDLPTVIANCEATGFTGVELRSTHKHGVEITLNANQRKEVAKRFADSKVKLAGLGSACDYHSVDPAELKANIEETKQFIRLTHDLGGGGVKVRPNGLPKEVPVEKTLEQIGRSLHEVAEFGADYGVAIRLEVHGRGTSEPKHIKTMMDIADHPNAYVCWNCNSLDLEAPGLEQNFNLVADKINTVHIHDLRGNKYPWEKLFSLLKAQNFTGWTLLEDGKAPDDIVAAMHENKKIWDQLTQS
ncbi:MAG: sugar phosphate isomerase/epimerase [Planctomycetes bacterium]|nr:sugar phosphate isomerase/epimerase [Planctomycetota bacterium]